MIIISYISVTYVYSYIVHGTIYAFAYLLGKYIVSLQTY